MFFNTIQAIKSAILPEKYEAGDSKVCMVLKIVLWNTKKNFFRKKYQASHNSVFIKDVVFHGFWLSLDKTGEGNAVLDLAISAEKLTISRFQKV